MQVDVLLNNDPDHLSSLVPAAGRARSASLTASSSNLAALPEGQATGGGIEVALGRVVGQEAEQQVQTQQQQQEGRENGRQWGGVGIRNGQGQSIDCLAFNLPPKYLFTCTVGRSMASKARCGDALYVPSADGAIMNTRSLPSL